MNHLTRVIVFAIFTCSLHTANSWGSTGHRVVGQIAENHLTKKAAKRVASILEKETLAEVGTFMDFIRSNPKYDHMVPWHYCTVPDGSTYEEVGAPAEGDVVVAIERLVQELKSKNFTDEDEAFAIKCLVHLVGDIHQPLHVGNGEDKGGNDVKLDYFWKPSNLHRVWDSGIIDNQQYSYTEYVAWIDHADDAQIISWQMDNIKKWVAESKSYHDQVYDIPQNKKLSYKYDYKNLELVNQRLLQAGIRLAGLLNEIYGS